MTNPSLSGLQHLRQRWAEENFSNDLLNGQSDLETGNGQQEAGQSKSSEVAAVPSFPDRGSSLNFTRLKPKKMSPWKDRIPSPKHLWRRQESSHDGLPEVNTAPPFPPASASSPSDGETIAQRSTKAAPGESSNQKAPPMWLTEIYTLSWLIFFSILGTLARLGVEAITQYPSAPVTSRVLWANVGGCFVMGFLIEDRRLFKKPKVKAQFKETSDPEVNRTAPEPDPAKLKAEHLKFKKTIPLYIGLTTGFCGSFTSFSSFMRDAFLALTNALADPSPTAAFQPSAQPNHARSGGFSFLAMLAILILHSALSFAALQVGAQFALLLAPITPRLPARPLQDFLNPLIVLISLGCWLGTALALTISPPYSRIQTAIDWRSRALIPMLFAPPGCLLRYYFSKYMNGLRPRFPLGTFTSNIVATAVLGMAWDLQHASIIRSANACAVLQGVIEGFCGCLSTVSTWVVELDGLGRRGAWIYGGVSSAVGLSTMLVIMGSMGWTVGFAPALCG